MSGTPRDGTRAERARLMQLAEAAADGRDVDWAKARSIVASREEGTLVEQLGVIAGVARVCRTAAPAGPTVTVGEAPSTRTPGGGPAADAAALTRWGPFGIGAVLGSGTFGKVYLARQDPLERNVALKILHGVESREGERLVEEARVLARIQHQHIVRIHGAARVEGQVGFWMEFIDGLTLEQIVREQGTRSAAEAALIGVDLCSALAAVHQRGLLHCDVKAQNVMRERGGRTVLMDFGAAILRPTPAGARRRRIGTPAYMAPELLEGGQPSIRSDLYALGVLLYYLVSGTFPVTGGSSDELREAHAHGRRQRLRDVRSDLPPSFIRIVDAATAPRPEDRPASAGALEAALLERPASRTAPRRRLRRPARSGARSIVVLRFGDTSPERTLDYLCEGIAESIIDALTRIPTLRVIGRSSAFRFDPRLYDPAEIVSALRVENILEGSVCAVGDRLRVTARLIDAATDVTLWSEQFERSLGDVFAVQDEIARAAVRALGPNGAGEPGGALPPGTSGTRSLEAYTLCVRGRFAWNQRTEAALGQSIGCFEQALGIDADYAEAHAGLADAYATLGFYGGVTPAAAMPKAREAARRAIALAGSLPGPHATLGCIAVAYERQWSDADGCFRRAIELAPMHPTARHWYAINYLVPLRRFEQAADELARAADADPLSTPIRASAGLLHYFARRFDLAERELRATLARDAASITARLFLGLTLVEAGRQADARRELETAYAFSATPEMTAALGYAAARAGDEASARRALADIEALGRTRYVSPSLVAQIHAGLGDREAALAALQAAAAARALDLPWLAVRPVFDRLRGDPRLDALLAALGL